MGFWATHPTRTPIVSTTIEAHADVDLIYTHLEIYHTLAYKIECDKCGNLRSVRTYPRFEMLQTVTERYQQKKARKQQDLITEIDRSKDTTRTRRTRTRS